jgi:hypothetical protein
MLRPVTRLLILYFFLVAVACVVVKRVYALHRVDGDTIATVWKDGAAVLRVVLPHATSRDARIDQALAESGGELASEIIVAEGPILGASELTLGMSFVAGKDGVRATLGNDTVYVTPDDLLVRQLYDHGVHIPALSLALGLDTKALAALLAEKLNTNPDQLLERASLRRIRIERRVASDRPRITADTLTRAAVKDAVVAGAHYLARGVSPDGHFRYAVNAPADRDGPGYDWARHAGATFFLAQAAALTGDPALADTCRRAASLLRGPALSTCGSSRCVGDEPVVFLGSSALALLAFSEIVEKKIDESYRPLVAELAGFMKAQQRPDGEFMHEYDRQGKHPIDYQYLYYSSEATLALARAYAITQDRGDLDAAVRGLRNLVGPAWSFFGDRYYFGEEHWTCQAMAVLWKDSPNPDALDFCLRWQAFGRALQQREGDSYFDADGAIGVSPVITPRLTPVASRGEAGVATLDIAKRTGVPAEEVAILDRQLRRALALLLRQQFRPGPRHLFKNPASVEGAIPGSEVDWELRIDYTQHAGSAMVRWLEVNDDPRL